MSNTVDPTKTLENATTKGLTRSVGTINPNVLKVAVDQPKDPYFPKELAWKKQLTEKLIASAVGQNIIIRIEDSDQAKDGQSGVRINTNIFQVQSVGENCKILNENHVGAWVIVSNTAFSVMQKCLWGFGGRYHLLSENYVLAVMDSGYPDCTIMPK